MWKKSQTGSTLFSNSLIAAVFLTAHCLSPVNAAGEVRSLSADGHKEQIQSLRPQAPLSEPAVSKNVTPFALSVPRKITQTGFPEIASGEDLVSAQSLMIQGRTFEELSRACAPELSAATAYRIALAFSGAKPWSVSVTGGSVVAAASEELALALISKLKERGKSVSLGLFQLSEDFIVQAGTDLSSALEPCRNLRLASRFLLTRYREYLGLHGMNFLAAREALEDLKAAAGKTTRYTHAEERTAMDCDLPEHEEDANAFSETAAVSTRRLGSRRGAEKQNAVKPPAPFIVLQKTGALNSVKARNKDERNNGEHCRSRLAVDSRLSKAGDKKAAKSYEACQGKDMNLSLKHSEGISNQGQKSFRGEKNIFPSEGSALVADGKTVLSPSSQRTY